MVNNNWLVAHKRNKQKTKQTFCLTEKKIYYKDFKWIVF